MPSLALCERCGATGATPYDVSKQESPSHPPDTVIFTLCPQCQTFVQSIEPICSEDEITGDNDWLSRIEPLQTLANDIAARQREIDGLRAKLTEKKKQLRLKVRQLDESLNDAQWSRMIEEQQLSGETATVFWLERYRKR